MRKCDGRMSLAAMVTFRGNSGRQVTTRAKLCFSIYVINLHNVHRNRYLRLCENMHGSIYMLVRPVTFTAHEVE